MQHTIACVVRQDARHVRHGFAPAINAFIRKRLEHFGVADVFFVDDLAAADALALDHDFVLVASSLNPLTDFAMVRAALAALEGGTGGPRRAVAHGCVPGTQFDAVVRTDGQPVAVGALEALPTVVVRCDAQKRLNNQFNLYKFKRLKLFLALIERFSGLWRLDVDEFAAFVDTRPVHDLLLSYGTGVALTRSEVCPHCGGSDLEPLDNAASQPVVGYLSSRRPTYALCGGCGLGFLCDAVPQQAAEQLYDAFADLDCARPAEAMAQPVTSKVAAAYALAEKHLSGPATVLDLGGGLGKDSLYIKGRHPDWTVVHSDFASRADGHLAAHGVRSLALDIASGDYGCAAYDLITAFEVIEHLDFAAFLGLLDGAARALRPGGLLLVTTPDMDSPLTRAFDFYNAYVPHHQLLFSRSWLETFFSGPDRPFALLETAAGGDLLDDWQSYFGYYAATSPTMQQRAAAVLLKTLLGRAENRQTLLDAGLGSEIIVLLRKK